MSCESSLQAFTQALSFSIALQADSFSGDELKEAEAVKVAVEEQTGGKLDVYTPNPEEDAAHW